MTDDGKLINQIKNLSLHLKIESVKIYKTNYYSNNIYYTDSFMGTPSVIIGRNVTSNLTSNEVVCLINACLIKIKNGSAKKFTLANLLFVINILPLLILHKLLSTTKLKSVTEFLIYPAYKIQKIFGSTKKETEDFDKLATEMVALKKDYLSAIFKINALEMKNLAQVSTIVVNDLTLVNNRPYDALASLIFDDETFTARAEKLK